MADLIRITSDFFDSVVSFISNIAHGISTFVNFLIEGYNSFRDAFSFFPAFLGELMLMLLLVLVFLRVLGR